jgi:hypothetical protein
MFQGALYILGKGAWTIHLTWTLYDMDTCQILVNGPFTFPQYINPSQLIVLCMPHMFLFVLWIIMSSNLELSYPGFCIVSLLLGFQKNIHKFLSYWTIRVLAGFRWFLMVSWVEKPLETTDPNYWCRLSGLGRSQNLSGWKTNWCCFRSRLDDMMLYRL